MDDHTFMEEALKEAQLAFEKDEVPIGAVLVYQGKIIARAHNLVESSQDASCHAELLCIKEGSRLLNNWRLTGCVLYCTLEPCIMCSGALILSRVDEVVWGAPDLRHGGNGSVIDVFKDPHPIHRLKIRGGIMQERCAKLLKDFFKLKRS